ncbi:aldose epimerase family protein [Planktothricoides raciborskii]|uniref:Aldose epimerase n=1 Tax=Planktothricoides raciborskii FACHB-1370 TaxID=2949576 RepID=A0ABR8EPT5_9CYAN|nr:aldose epimerase [Planktothricoides raciborskii]MBD2547890.1 aldose epimerase [Planktothricoides raciborskii FACHB-1370]MBD2585372.1 aldose epimerase [Planktothricoides raciborskii FACHB-1261]
MFAIAAEQKQYKTYSLIDRDANALVEVVPERGGIITRWCINDTEILYLDAERFASPELSVRGGIPILFPICGNLPDNTYIYKGKKYNLKQHGFARDLPWQITERMSKNFAGMTITLVSNPETLRLYPFDFQLAFTYILEGNTLTIRQSYSNFSNHPMPFSCGFHPYFAVADKSQLKFDLPSSEYIDHITHTNHPFNGTFDFNQPEIDVAFPQLSDRSATVTDPSRNLQITLEYDTPYSALVFWTIQGKDYYCLEPWTGLRNALNTGDRLIHLEPGGTFETVTKLVAKIF